MGNTTSNQSNMEHMSKVKTVPEVKVAKIKQRLHASDIDDLSDKLKETTLETSEYDNVLLKLTKGTSDWGHYQHSPTDTFVGESGYIMDLETCWSLGGWSQTFIQQIGACPIGMDKANFEILCDFPEHCKYDNMSSLIQCMKDNSLDVEKTIGCWKKVLKLRRDNDLINYLNTSKSWWVNRTVDDYSVENMEALKSEYYKQHRKLLIFPLKHALEFFVNYFKDKLVWYAHNGNRFDYPIMEKQFHNFGYPYSCVPQPNAPGKKTTAMGAEFRSKYKLPKGDKIIKCYDTMLMMKQHPASIFVKRGFGAKRVSQGVAIGWEEKNGVKTQIVWSKGSKTANMYSYKLQDIINEIGIRANDVTAHTALADCVTLRECLYRVFSPKSLQEIRNKAAEAVKLINSKSNMKILRRLSKY